MLSLELLQKNKTGLSWWAKNYNNASSFDDVEAGSALNVSIYDIMPRLTNEEFEISEGSVSFTDSVIEVFTNKDDVLVICDGHHRFNSAVKNGHQRVDVIVKETRVSNLFTGISLFYSLSNDQVSELAAF
jgi:hypothetical protein